MARKPSIKRSERAEVGETTARVETMRAAVLSGLLKGMSCPAIAEQLAISRSRAHQLGAEAIKLLIAETIEQTEAWRAILSQRWLQQLDKGEALRDRVLLSEKVDTYALEAANGMVSKALAELAKLFGANVPVVQKVDTTSNGQTLAQPTVFAVPLMAGSVEEWSSSQSLSQPQS
jgi:hypothetical protein